MSRPRALVHRGCVLAGAVLVEPERIGESAARARILGLWEPGVVVRQCGEALLVELASPRRLRADRAPGALLESRQGAWVAAPVQPEAGEGVFAVVAGELDRIPLGAAVDPAGWLELDAFEPVALEPLSAPPRPVKIVEAHGPSARDYAVREPGPEAEALLEELRQAVGQAAPWWAGPLQALLRWMPRRQPAGRAPAGSTELAPSGPGLLDRLIQGLHLDRLFGARASQLAQKLVDDLLTGDLDEALRRAIPLAGDGSGPGGFALSWNLPFRSALEVGQRSTGSGSSFAVGEGLFDLLRRTYEEVALRLEREGQIEQAAYVLAELLDRGADAVALCERHERYALGARIAEARGLEPSVVVRLWVLAGEIDRAMDVALLSGSFATALFQLERSHPAQAAILRTKWGIALAEAGRHLAAVKLLETLSGPPRFLFELAEQGIEAGGAAAGELAVRRLGWGADDAAAEHLLALFADPGEPRRDERLAALEQLAKSDLDPRFARSGIRALFRDEAAIGGQAELRRKLLVQARDPILARDLPSDSPPTPSPLRLRHTTALLEVEGAGSGTRIEAVARLADGGLAVGLGDGGLRVLDRRGAVRGHLEIPVRALVPSDDRTRLLALEQWSGDRVWRIDPRAIRAELLGRLRLVAWAPDFDGMTWLIAESERVRLLDVRGEPRSLWSTDLRLASELQRDGERLRAIAEGELWTYQLGSRRDPILRTRSAVEGHPVLGPGGQLGQVRTEGDHTALRTRMAGQGGGRTDVGLDPRWYADAGLSAGADWVVWGDGRTALIAGSTARAVLEIHGEAPLSAADPGRDHLVLGFEDGQVAVVDLRTGARGPIRGV